MAIEVNRKEIIRTIADNRGLSIKDVKLAVESQFDFTAEVIRTGNFDWIRLPYFGIFKVVKGRVEHLNRMKRGK